MSNLTGWLLSKSKWIFFQQSLTASLPKNSLLGIPVKKGEDFGDGVEVALKGEHCFEREQKL